MVHGEKAGFDSREKGKHTGMNDDTRRAYDADGRASVQGRF